MCPAFTDPCNWAAWLSVVSSCSIGRGLKRENSLDGKKAHLMGLDLNIVAAYAYPLIAAINFLADKRLYLSGHLTDNVMARLAAQLLVVRTGAAIGVMLTVICTYSWSSGRSHTGTVIFSVTCSIFLSLIAKVFELGCVNFTAQTILHTIFWLPTKARAPVVRERLYAPMAVFSRLDDYIQSEFDLDLHSKGLQFVENLPLGFALLQGTWYCGEIVWHDSLYHAILFYVYLIL
jgi:hypothetical protein